MAALTRNNNKKSESETEAANPPDPMAEEGKAEVVPKVV